MREIQGIYTTYSGRHSTEMTIKSTQNTCIYRFSKCNDIGIDRNLGVSVALGRQNIRSFKKM